MKTKVIYFLICFTLLNILGNGQDIYSPDSLSTHQIKFAPNFYLLDLKDNGHFLNDYCGVKKTKFKKSKKEVVILSFWATWCIPCRNELQILKKLSNSYSQDSLMIFLTNIEEPPEKVSHFAKEKKIKILILLDRYGVVKKNYGVTSIPCLFLINPDQKIVYRHVGYNPDEPLFEILSQKIDSLFLEYYHTCLK